jgi:hypothetical protein
MNHNVAIATGSIELVISALPPSERLEGPFDHFETLMTRRFDAWHATVEPREVEALRVALFAIQIEAHARELHRLVDKHVGGLYFATHPVDPAHDGAWEMLPGVGLGFEILTRYFRFDFESFPAESFLRRQPGDKRVVQAALMRPRACEEAQ